MLGSATGDREEGITGNQRLPGGSRQPAVPLSARPMSMTLTNREIAGRLTAGSLLIRTPSGHGSGVKITETRILTAAHVITPDDPKNWNASTCDFDVGIGQQRSAARCIAYEPKYDIAVLEPAEPTRLASIPSFLISDEFAIGDDIWVGGYPYYDDIPIIRRGVVSSIVVPLETTIVTRSMFASPTVEFPQIWLDVPIFPGNSGGPVLNSEGDLIGLANAVRVGPDLADVVGIDSEVIGHAQVRVFAGVGFALHLTRAVVDLGLSEGQVLPEWRKPA